MSLTVYHRKAAKQRYKTGYSRVRHLRAPYKTKDARRRPLGRMIAFLFKNQG